jgi:hypothetical protein
MSFKNNKHDSTVKMLQQICGQLAKDFEAIIQEVEQDSHDTGYDAGYAKCLLDHGLRDTRDVPTRPI